jgi:phosphoadenosine phosphosulfate reductase
MESIYKEPLQRTLELLREISSDFRPATLANGLGLESMVMTYLIAKHGIDIEIVTLDTGRLPAETHIEAQKIFERYGPIIRMISPDPDELQAWTLRYGPNAFYQSVERRRECCNIRKVAPLGRVLKGKKAWITGLRRGESASRAQLGEREWDAKNGLHKFNPMVGWTREQVWAYIHDHSVPYNGLHDRGYTSIGCAPCTRAPKPGEDTRAGRWWWERDTTKECGLHLDPVTQRLQRKLVPSTRADDD